MASEDGEPMAPDEHEVQPLLAAQASPNALRGVFGSNARIEGDCQLDAKGITITEDRLSIAFYVKNFEAKLVPPARIQTVTCWFHYDIQGVPPGLTYRATAFNYNLDTVIPDSVAASMNVSYYFEGEGIPEGTTVSIPSTGGEYKPLARSMAVAAPLAPCSAKREMVARVKLVLLKKGSSDPNYEAWLAANSAQASNLPSTVSKAELELKLEWPSCAEASSLLIN